MKRLFHATRATFETPIPGGYDKVFWTAESSAVAQTYIPRASASACWHVPTSGLDQHVWPNTGSVEYAVAAVHMGMPAQNIERDATGRVRGFTLPKGYPTYADVIAYVTKVLGYEVDEGRIWLKLGHFDATHQVITLLPAEYLAQGWLWIVEEAQHLRIHDFATGREGCLLSPDYHRLELFRALEAQGFDGVRINDCTHSRTWGSVEHVAVGFFRHAIPKLKLTRIPAHHFDWPEYKQALEDIQESPDYLDWRAGQERDPLLRIQAQLRRGEAVVVSDRDYDALVDRGLYDVDIVSVYNPDRVGILDALLIGRKTSPQMRAAIDKRVGQIGMAKAA